MSLILSALAGSNKSAILIIYCMIINSIAIVLCKNAMIMKMQSGTASI